MDQVGQQFHHGPPADHGGGHGLGPGVPLGKKDSVRADELPELLMAADLTRAGIVDHHLARPHRLQDVRVALVQRGEVLRDRIGVTGGVGLLRASSTALVKSGNHGMSAPMLAGRPGGGLRMPTLSAGNLLTPALLPQR